MKLLVDNEAVYRQSDNKKGNVTGFDNNYGFINVRWHGEDQECSYFQQYVFIDFQTRQCIILD